MRFIPLVSIANGGIAHTTLDIINLLDAPRPIGMKIIVLQNIGSVPWKCRTGDIWSKSGTIWLVSLKKMIWLVTAVHRHSVSHTKGTEAATQVAGDWPLRGEWNDPTQWHEYSTAGRPTWHHVAPLQPQWAAVHVEASLGQSPVGREDTLGILLLAKVGFTFKLLLSFSKLLVSFSNLLV